MLAHVCVVNHGDYIRAVLDRNIAENISRVLYPVDNVRIRRCWVHATAVERRSLTGELSLSCARPAADG